MHIHLKELMDILKSNIIHLDTSFHGERNLIMLHYSPVSVLLKWQPLVTCDLLNI